MEETRQHFSGLQDREIKYLPRTNRISEQWKKQIRELLPQVAVEKLENSPSSEVGPMDSEKGQLLLTQKQKFNFYEEWQKEKQARIVLKQTFFSSK